MQLTYLLGLLLQLSYLQLSLAESVVTMAWVGFPNGRNFWTGYEGRVLEENGETTTYAINCPPTSPKSKCVRFVPDATFIAAPSSYNFAYGDSFQYTSTGCSFAGAPTPTIATCSYSRSWHIRSSTVTREKTYVVPGTGLDSIRSATLTVAGSGAFPTGKVATSTAATTAMTSTEPSTASRTGTAVVETATASTTASGNGAGRTVAPIVLVGAMVAGVAMQV